MTATSLPIGSTRAWGFEHYSGNIEFHATPEDVPAKPPLPEGYTQSPLSRFDWRPRYELEKCISPQTLLKYEPVDEDRFRQPVMLRLLWPLYMLAQGTREAGFIIRTAAEGRIVAQGGYTITTRGQGLNRLNVSLDSGHLELAPYMVRYLLHKVMTLSPGHRIEFSVPQWMEAVLAASKEAGFKRRLEYCRMGLEL